MCTLEIEKAIFVACTKLLMAVLKDAISNICYNTFIHESDANISQNHFRLYIIQSVKNM